ncbi:hypothetical protein RZS08_29335, partial [Arthrospira platensis SPKY1]|nr:hypothetical protein [Arthrospira platensis SPKY1]
WCERCIRRDSEGAQRTLGNAGEHRRRNRTTEMLAGAGLVDHHRDDQPRVGNRRETNEGGNVLVRVAAALELVRGPGLAGDPVPRDPRPPAGALRPGRLFEHHTQGLRG